jgi:membrane protease YdiL (CAAX protease family)
MDPILGTLLTKVAPPAFAIVVVLWVSKLRGISWSDGIGLVWPRPRVLVAWIGFWVAWMAATELAGQALHLEPPAPWKGFSLPVILLRVLAIGFLGPAAEEIVMRGVIFHRLARTRVGDRGAVVLTAAAWAMAHVQYDRWTIGFIFLDGLVLGTARLRSRSICVPIVMHSLGNLFSIAQSLRS